MGDNRTPQFIGLHKEQFLMIMLLVFALTSTLSLVALGLSVRANSHAADAARNKVLVADKLIDQTHSALCGIKYNAQKQVEATANLLATNTKAEPIPGISRQTFVDSLKRQRDFRDTLKELDCP